MTAVYERPSIYAGDADCHVLSELRELACELCVQYGMDPNIVCRIDYDVIDMGLLRFWVYCHDEDGKFQVKLDADGQTVPVLASFERPIHQLPAWWRP